jgi:hypothetical protein
MRVRHESGSREAARLILHRRIGHNSVLMDLEDLSGADTRTHARGNKKVTIAPVCVSLSHFYSPFIVTKSIKEIINAQEALNTNTFTHRRYDARIGHTTREHSTVNSSI